MTPLDLVQCSQCRCYFTNGVDGENEVCDVCAETEFEEHPFQPTEVLDDTSDA